MNTFMNTFINTLITTKLGLDTLPVRLGAGVIFNAHGVQKLFGLFGGYGLVGTAGWMESIGLAPGILMAAAAGGAEFFGGLLLIAALLVRPTAFVLAVTMLVAIITVHAQHGLFMSNNGYEFALALLVISAGLVVRGAGSLSIDSLLQSKTKKINA